MPELWDWVAAPLACAETGHGDGEVPQTAEDEEDGEVGGGGIDGCGCVGDVDGACCAGFYVYLIISGSYR